MTKAQKRLKRAKNKKKNLKDNKAEDIRNMSDDEILLAWFIIIKSWEDESTHEYSPVGRWEKEWYQDCIYFEVYCRDLA